MLVTIPSHTARQGRPGLFASEVENHIEDHIISFLQSRSCVMALHLFIALPAASAMFYAHDLYRLRPCRVHLESFAGYCCHVSSGHNNIKMWDDLLMDGKRVVFVRPSSWIRCRMSLSFFSIHEISPILWYVLIWSAFTVPLELLLKSTSWNQNKSRTLDHWRPHFEWYEHFPAMQYCLTHIY